jgi:hydrogenase expression/formation protein HypC
VFRKKQSSCDSYAELRQRTAKRGIFYMCLAIPSKITKIENEMAIIDVDGVQREASLLLLTDARVGDFVIVHAGFAIQKIDEVSAQETLKLLKEAAEHFESQFGKTHKLEE